MQQRRHQQPWIRPVTGPAHPRTTLVCLPHAGGSANTFTSWAPAVPPGVALHAVQYPGRGDRLNDPLVETVRETASYLATELLRTPPAPTALFGHSLGALIAYETALLLRDLGRPPVHLFVSGCPAPRLAGGGESHRLDDADFWESVCALGGVPPELASHAELRELALPALRADIRASELYRPPAAGPIPLTCPVRCYHGDGDLTVDPARLRAWAETTTGPCTTRTRPGGHFHTGVDPLELAADVTARLTPDRNRAPRPPHGVGGRPL